MRLLLVVSLSGLMGCYSSYHPEAHAETRSRFTQSLQPDAVGLAPEGGAPAVASQPATRKGDKGEGRGKSALTEAGSGDRGVSAKTMALLHERLGPLVGARRAGAMTSSDFEANRLKVLGELGFIPPARCAMRGVPYSCAHSNVLPERLLGKVKRMPAAGSAFLNAFADPTEALAVTAILDPGRRIPFLYVTARGEIVRLFYDRGRCVGWSEGDPKDIPLDVSRITDVEPAEAPPQEPSGSPEVLTHKFDPVAAHATLDAVDATACWPSAAHGYGKARVTFAPDGTVQNVDIASPMPGISPDSACIGQTFGAATVWPFDGPSVTAYATFYLPATGPGGMGRTTSDWREQPHRGPVRSCRVPRALGLSGPSAPLAQCSARGVLYPCAHSNILSPPVQRKVKLLPRSQGLPDEDVGAYGDAGLVLTRPVRVTLADGASVGFVYVAERGEIVKVFFDRDQSWWTEGDEKQIPVDVSAISDAAPSEQD
jgi:hypothetical protein